MKRFLAGLLVGIISSALAVWAQRPAKKNFVPPKVIVENSKVKMERWLIKPGQGLSPMADTRDRITVVIHGSLLWDVAAGGSATQTETRTGEATYSILRRPSHYLVNVGNQPFEAISIEVK